VSAPLLLRGGRVVDPSQKLDGTHDVLLADGRVAALGDDLEAPEGARTIDCSGLVLTPGLIDVHVHLREPGGEHKETIASGARAAAAGGFTAVCAMPNTDPPIDDPATVAISDDGSPVMDSGLMRLALEYATAFGIPVADHPEDLTLSGRGVMNEGLASARLGLPGKPNVAEEMHIVRDLLLAELAGAHIHLQHISTRFGVESIRRARARGVHVTAEASPHHLTLTEAAVEGYRTEAKMNPPLRTEADRAAVREGLADGTLDIIATDHAPHHYDEKEAAFQDAPNGVVGLETAVGLILTHVVDEGVLDLPTMVERMSCQPARAFHLEGGTLTVGSVADVTVIDPEAVWTVDPTTFRSRSRNTPFGGWKLKGRARYTVVGGALVWEG